MRGLSRRQLVAGGAALVAGGGAAAALGGRGAGYYLPPDMGSINGLVDAFSHASARALIGRGALVPEYPVSAISMVDNWKTDVPADPELLGHLRTGFAQWHLPVGGSVRQEARISLADLGQMAVRTQIVARHCINGYTSISPYTGVRLRDVLALTGVAPRVRYIGFESWYDMGWDTIDLFDAFHPQTLLAFEELPGTRISWTRGAPLRLSVPLHYGYKWIKGIRRIVALENLDSFGDGTGSGSAYASKGRTWSGSGA